MKTVFVNVYTNPLVAGEFEGNEHVNRELADAAAEHELGIEPQTVRVRCEERTKAE